MKSCMEADQGAAYLACENMEGQRWRGEAAGWEALGAAPTVMVGPDSDGLFALVCAREFSGGGRAQDAAAFGAARGFRLSCLSLINHRGA